MSARRLVDALKARFSALQRAEIAEISAQYVQRQQRQRFSALQRAEIAEMGTN